MSVVILCRWVIIQIHLSTTRLNSGCSLPTCSAKNVQRLVFVEFFHGADFWNQLFGFFRADRSVPIGVLVIEDEVHFV